MQQHGLNYINAPRVFRGPTCNCKDERFDCSEQRFVTLGLLDELVVLIVDTQTPRQFRVRATKHEQTIFIKDL
jgi:uncharacterized protein